MVGTPFFTDMVAINSAQELFGAFFTISFALSINRTNEEFRSYDTYAAWKGSSHAIKRLLAAWTFVTILPLMQFGLIISLLSDVTISNVLTFTNIMVLVAIGFLSFFEFGYYRIFEGVIYVRPEAFFPEAERQEYLSEERREFWSHFIPGIFYIASSFLLLLFIFSVDP